MVEHSIIRNGQFLFISTSKHSHLNLNWTRICDGIGKIAIKSSLTWWGFWFKIFQWYVLLIIRSCKKNSRTNKQYWKSEHSLHQKVCRVIFHNWRPIEQILGEERIKINWARCIKLNAPWPKYRKPLKALLNLIQTWTDQKRVPNSTGEISHSQSVKIRPSSCKYHFKWPSGLHCINRN